MNLKSLAGLVCMLAFFSAPFFIQAAPQKDQKKEQNPYARHLKEIRKIEEKIIEAKPGKSLDKLKKDKEKAEEKLEKAVEKDTKAIDKKLEALDSKLEKAKDDAKEKIQTEIDALNEQLEKIEAWSKGEEPEEKEDAEKENKNDK